MTTSQGPQPTSAFPVPGFADRLEWVEERSAVLRGVAESGDEARVPGCPDWTVRDLVAHLGKVQRFWAGTVAMGTTGNAPLQPGPEVDGPPSGDLLAWSAQSTRLLLDALHAAGPDAACWTWWAGSGNPATAGAVARHQVQEAAVHAWDARDAVGAPRSLPAALAVDAVDEFLHIGFGSVDGWPHSPARVALASDEGPAWTLILDATGASPVRGGPGEGPEAGAVLSGPAGDLLLALYRRLPLEGGSLRVTGDAELVRQLVVWPPLD